MGTEPFVTSQGVILQSDVRCVEQVKEQLDLPRILPVQWWTRDSAPGGSFQDPRGYF